MLKNIGLLLGDENDWPTAVELLAKKLNRKFKVANKEAAINVQRIRIHPFSLKAQPQNNLIIDRLAYWHTNPREWLKKAALINNVYLLNNPFTFQSMEKHSAYCAMIRLGLHIPETWLIPPKNPPAGYEAKFQKTAERYHDMFDLSAIAQEIGYPMFMKPFDGGGWRGVSMIKNETDLHNAYNDSGHMNMHLQKGLADYDVFVRSLGIGPQVASFNYDASQPQHGRYVIDHDFLSAEKGWEAQAITKTINAFFRWEFNSCESILKDDLLSPIDFANACPDVAITSLHYYFPWAMKSLLAWSIFCAVSERQVRITMDMERYFEIADNPDLNYREKLERYEALADAYFEKEAFEDFKAKQLADLDEVMWELVQSPEFDHIIVETVQTFFPAHEHEQFIAHYRGIMDHWVKTNG